MLISLLNEYYFTENYFKKTFTNDVTFGNIKMDKPLVCILLLRFVMTSIIMSPKKWQNLID